MFRAFNAQPACSAFGGRLLHRYGIPQIIFLFMEFEALTRKYAGKDEIDREEEAFLAHQAATKGNKRGNWFYRTFVSWLF